MTEEEAMILRMQIERALRIAGVLLMLGIVVEIISLLWEKPMAFLLFAGVGGSLTFAGIVCYLYSLLPEGPDTLPPPSKPS
jgi:hypothetical protein